MSEQFNSVNWIRFLNDLKLWDLIGNFKNRERIIFWKNENGIRWKWHSGKINFCFFGKRRLVKSFKKTNRYNAMNGIHLQ